MCRISTSLQTVHKVVPVLVFVNPLAPPGKIFDVSLIRFVDSTNDDLKVKSPISNAKEIVEQHLNYGTDLVNLLVAIGLGEIHNYDVPGMSVNPIHLHA